MIVVLGILVGVDVVLAAGYAYIERWGLAALSLALGLLTTVPLLV